MTEPHPLLDDVFHWGADLVAVADTTRLAGIETEPAGLLDGFPRAVSMAVRLSSAIVDQTKTGPTPLYSQHYIRVNNLLDDLAVRLTNRLQEEGARALPLPASQILCETRFTSYLSHKAVAIAAGLGWQGKSLLLVTPQYGPRVRLVTVLTDHPLPPNEPLTNHCGKCTACTDACPAGAIKNVNTQLHYATRNEAVDLDACVRKLREFSTQDHIRPYICGVCVSACPWGKPKTRRQNH
ncbi:4Fe-4S double cluster binding domain-containing protein [Desulfovibrio inopinatus]|uniref:4Fe-4S double cluster binding domain-containing protein n=1 Tax=Desulfovibrio inopinatus TaxID=102109 RepID=UPI00040213B4|nr:4Fe-4S double cluster binding domain-containing protein [Desulfovibrio inopinatus]